MNVVGVMLVLAFLTSPLLDGAKSTEETRHPDSVNRHDSALPSDVDVIPQNDDSIPQNDVAIPQNDDTEPTTTWEPWTLERYQIYTDYLQTLCDSGFSDDFTNETCEEQLNTMRAVCVQNAWYEGVLGDWRNVSRSERHGGDWEAMNKTVMGMATENAVGEVAVAMVRRSL